MADGKFYLRFELLSRPFTGCYIWFAGDLAVSNFNIDLEFRKFTDANSPELRVTTTSLVTKQKCFFYEDLLSIKANSPTIYFQKLKPSVCELYSLFLVGKIALVDEEGSIINLTKNFQKAIIPNKTYKLVDVQGKKSLSQNNKKW